MPLCLYVTQAQGPVVSLRKIRQAKGSPPFLFFDNYGKKEGVPNTLEHMHQDQMGYLWLALASGQGAARFDGTVFRQFNKNRSDTSSFPSNAVQSWLRDREGALWMATETGVFRQEGATGRFQPKPTVRSCIFMSFLQDKKGRIWAGTEAAGLAYYDPQRDSMVLYPGTGITNGYTGEFRPNNSFDSFRYLFETPDGLIWAIATIYSKNGPARTMPVSIHPDRHDIRFYPMKAGEAMDFASAYHYDAPAHSLWVGTGRGEMIRFGLGDHAYTVYTFEKNNTSQEIIFTIVPRDTGSFWVGSTEGVKIFDAQKEHFYPITPQTGQSYSIGRKVSCKHIYKDRDGNTWFLLGNALSKLSPVRQQFPTNQLLPDGFEAQAMATLPNTEELVMASYGDNGVLDVYAGKPNSRNWRHATTIVRGRCTGTCHVSVLLPQPEGPFWVGMNTGLGMLDPKTLRYTAVDKPIVGDKSGLRTTQIWVTDLLPESSGDVWIATWNAGLLRYEAKTGRFISYTFNIPLFNICYRALGKDAQGRLLLGSNGTGLEVWDPKTGFYQLYEPQQDGKAGIIGRFVFSIATDVRGRIWLGTENGVCQFLTEAPNGVVFVPTQTPKIWTPRIETDKKGRLWLKTGEGLSVYEPERDISTTIGEKQGFTISLTEQTPLFRDKTSWLWCGNRLWFDPAQWRNPPLRATPVLTGIKLHDQPWAGGTLDGSATTVEWPHTDNAVRFEMAALDFDAPPGESHFKVKLDATPYGLFTWAQPGEWTDLGTQNFATFANLSPGTYRFHYLTGNETSGWMEASQARSFSFVIRPHWANTWPFYLLLACTVMGLLAGATAFYYRYQLRAQQLESEKQQREAERQRLALEKAAAVAVSERKATESDMKLLRAQLNPHFLFNAMNSVNRYILANEKDKASEYLGQFAQLTRSILENSQSLTIPLVDELKMLEQYLGLENHRFHQGISWDFVIDPDLDPEDLLVPSMFLQPFAENAILHGLAPKGGGSIAVTFGAADGRLRCTVRDDGVGRNARSAGQMPVGSPKRASVGMRLISERLDAFAALEGQTAQVTISDLTDEGGQPAGTEVCISLPLVAAF